MRTVVLGPRPAELEALLVDRQRKGIDRYDEVWEGEYHMNPGPSGPHGMLDDEVAAVLRPFAAAAGLVATSAFNLGTSDDYRVPDRGLHRTAPLEVWNPTAALVVEILSPDDESWAKLGFYAARGVDEVVIVDPATRRIHWLVRQGAEYQLTDRSALLAVDAAEISDRITWPPEPDGS